MKKILIRYGIAASAMLLIIFTTMAGADMKNNMTCDMKTRLTPMQYRVTQEKRTEMPFHNEYWDEHRDGVYVDVVTGKVLFTSKDKFNSGTGWPSFTRPADEGAVKEALDAEGGMVRTEVVNADGTSHLGHVFNDGPAPTGRRYCINSAALKFIPKESLEKSGYGNYRSLFDKGA